MVMAPPRRDGGRGGLDLTARISTGPIDTSTVGSASQRSDDRRFVADALLRSGATSDVRTCDSERSMLGSLPFSGALTQLASGRHRGRPGSRGG